MLIRLDLRILPLCFQKTSSVHFRHIHHIYTVSSMNGNTTASCNISNNLITGNRITAFGEAYCNVMNAPYYNAALALDMMLLILIQMCIRDSDNGISAADQIAFAKKMGMTVVVTDHHEVPFEDTEEGRKYKLPRCV